MGNNLSMRRNVLFVFVLAAMMVSSAMSAVAQSAAPVAAEISYTVSMSKPWTHLLEIEMRVRSNSLGANTDLIMPVWTPGSYLVREYARHVQDFAAKDGGGNALTWEKTNKNTWRIAAKGTKEIVVTYQVYANELTVRTNELNDEHAFWNNSALLMYPNGQLKSPSTVKVNPYGNWKIATGLPAVAGQANTFRAESFDVLYDSPFEVSDFKEISFDYQGKPHRIVVDGEGNYDLNQLKTDFAKIVEATAQIFGGDIPYKDYTFIINLRGGGGLEHLNSTALQANRNAFKPYSRYQGFLGLVSHEYFHVWNVKNIRPDALGPFDYSNENYTKLLWVAEGGTEYYSNLILVRAGLMSDKEFLSILTSSIRDLQDRPGRLQTSLEEASWDAWIKYYRQDENAINNQISYYDKGNLVFALLDVEIRSASKGTKSMDDVFRFLNAEYAKKNRNFSPADFQKASEAAAGKSLNDFFRKYVAGREEINYNETMNGLGLQVDVKPGPAAPFFGASTTSPANSERVNISTITAGSPAFEQGLNTGDQIVAIDGTRAVANGLQTAIATKKPGDKIDLTIFRFDRMRTMEFTIGGKSDISYRFSPLTGASDDQKKFYRDWLKAELK